MNAGAKCPRFLAMIIAIHQNYRDINTPLSFDFHCIICVQVENLLKEVNVSKSSGHDVIPPRLIKASAATIAESIANIYEMPIFLKVATRAYGKWGR